MPIATPDAIPSVQPNGPSGGFLNVNASPDAFGAGVASAISGLGQSVQHAGQEAGDIALKQQGMLNETMATNAETTYMDQLSKLSAAYKSKEGLAAVAALPQYSQDVQDLRQQLLETLPNPAVQKAFTTLALRHEGYALSDANNYSATQVKKADADSAHASVLTAVSRAGDSSIAANDMRFEDILHDVNFGVARQMQTQGWDAGTGMTQQDDGLLSFDDSENGKRASSVYQSVRDTAVGKAWEERLRTLSNSNVDMAAKLFQDNRSRIPGTAQVQIEAFLQPKIKDAQTRSIADNVIGTATQTFTNGLNKGSNNPGNIKSAYGIANNVPDFENYATPADGVNATASNLRNNYRGMTLAEIGRKWVGKDQPQSEVDNWVNNVSRASGLAPNAVPNMDDKTAVSSLIKAIVPAEKGQADRAAFDDTSVTQGIEQAFAGQKPTKVANAAGNDNRPMLTSTDYLRQNYAAIVKQAEDQAEAQRPGDQQFRDLARSRVEQRLGDQIRQQEMSYKADNDLVVQAVSGELNRTGQKPTSIEQLTSISPDVKAAWERSMAHSPQFATSIQTHVLTAAAHGVNKDAALYGKDFPDLVAQVLAPSPNGPQITDPSQLMQHFKDGGLNFEGLKHLQTLMAQNDSEKQLQTEFLKAAKGQITGSNEHMGFVDPKGINFIKISWGHLSMLTKRVGQKAFHRPNY